MVRLVLVAAVLASVAMLYQFGQRVQLPFSCGPSSRYDSHRPGLSVVFVPSLAQGADYLGARPEVGDRLWGAGGLPTRHVIDAWRLAERLDEQHPHTQSAASTPAQPVSLAALRSAGTPVVDHDIGRWVKLDLYRGTAATPLETWVRLRGNSWPFVGLALALFLVEMTVLGVGAWLVWRRPSDPAAVVYFALCATSAVACIGLSDWPGVLVSRQLGWLCVFCAALVAPLALHLLAIVPRPSRFVSGGSRWALVALYLLPAVWLLAACVCAVQIERLADRPEAATEASLWIARLAELLVAYIGLSMCLLAAGLGRAALVYATSRSRVRRNQARWILAAVVVLLPVVVWLASLAAYSPATLAFGSAPRGLLIVAQLVFAAALAASVSRVPSTFGGPLVNQGLVYVGVSLAATGIFCLLVGLGTAVVGRYYLQWENALAAGLTAMMMVALFGWLRVRLQTTVDRRFLRQKYQLDKALRRLAAAVDRLVEADQLAGQMLQAARDCVGAQRGAVYLRDKVAQRLALSARIGWPTAPAHLSAISPMVAEGRAAGVLSSRSALTSLPSAGQLQMRDLEAELAVPLELEGRVVGLLLLGPKADESTYSAEDQNFLLALARTTTLALQSAAGHRTIDYLQTRLADHVAKIAEQQRRIVFLQGELLNRGAQRPAGRAARNEGSGEAKDSEPKNIDHVERAASGSHKPEPADAVALADRTTSPELYGSSPALKQLLAQAIKIASSPASVLIRGESGTGKELLARTIHAHSPRCDGPFVAVHCAALSAGLLESELFGHVKGAYTGADRDRPGRFELAHGGTLFLDEIGDISLETQIKLLRVLQERAFERVGGVARIEVDVRVIAATHQHLEDLIRRGRFREDLFYRLNVISLRCPPLRERSGDVFELALRFLRHYSQRAGKHLTRIDDDALEALAACPWPGNIRQLENAIERAVVLAEGESITRADLPPEVLAAAELTDVTPPRRRKARLPAPSAADGLLLGAHAASDAPFDEVPDEFERDRLLATLHDCGGNKALAARRLGMPRSTLFSKLHRLGIE
ncbi:MAG: sigma-54-dependent Fis family transcriptional regulator [Pirellulales bacterium]|nr:sigma-54-dependent Fis family transcriptional regulator [Pirellulales bacterium]